MKKYILIAALAATTIGFAQKRELKKVQKAIADKDYVEAKKEFDQIPAAEVEDKSKGEYAFYKAVIMLGKPESPTSNGADLRTVVTTLKEAEELGYDEKEQITYYRNAAADAVLKNAQTKFGSGDKENALTDLKFLSELYPENSKMRENVANISFNIEDYATAQPNYEKLLADGYTGVETTVLATDLKSGEKVAFANQKAAELGVMSKEYKDIVTEESESQMGTMISNLAWIYKQNGEMEKATTLIENALRDNPNDVSLKAVEPNLYLILEQNDKYEAAIGRMNEEITDPKVFENLGVGAASKEDWDKAIGYYNQSLRLDPENYVVQNNIAVAYINKANNESVKQEEQKELYTLAAGHYKKVTELKPDLASAKQTLLGLYEFLKMTEEAEALKAKM